MRTNLLVFGFITMTSAATFADDSERMEPKHITKLKYVTGAVVSPGGEWAAYTVAVPRRPLLDDNGPAWTELHVASFEDDQLRPFITDQVNIGSPHWSPDGDSIYYTAKRSGDDVRVLYRIPINGGESVRAWVHPTAIGGFDISPDGRRVAFLAKEDRAESDKTLRDQGFDQQIYEEDLQPTKVWIAPIDPSAMTPDPDSVARKLDLEGSASAIQWSPNGQELMVALAPTPTVDDGYMFKRVHVVDAESGRLIRLVANPGKLGQVVWSPDGKRLAMVSGESLSDPQQGRLMVATIDGDEELKDLIPKLDAHITSVAWKDDTTLYWLAGEGVATRFGQVTLDGQRQDLIEPGDTVLSGFSIGKDSDSTAFWGHTRNHPAELFLADDPSTTPRRVTDLNPWLDNLRLADQAEVVWKARDGLELQGVLIYPLDYVEGRRYPTIMSVHGGPESHESNGWLTSYSKPGQVAAARGFAVFYPNYRGSTGRGVAFSKMGQADAAGKEFDDLVDGIDHLIDIGIADPDAIGVTGGSYGGYATAWCSTYYSDRFAAGVMFVGISDNVSKVGTTDIPEEMYLVHHLKRLWDDRDYFAERSPIRYVEKNQTPTLILHGKEDPRVHPSQSLELHRHLKTLGKAPVRLVLYEGEGHGNRKAASRLDYNLRMLRWMEQFLQQKSDTAPEMEIDYREALELPSDE